MPKSAPATGIVESIGQLRHEELRLQLLELTKLTAESRQLAPLNETIPALRAIAAPAFASEASIQVITDILSRIYEVPGPDVSKAIGTPIKDLKPSPIENLSTGVRKRTRGVRSTKQRLLLADAESPSSFSSLAHLKQNEDKTQLGVQTTQESVVSPSKTRRLRASSALDPTALARTQPRKGKRAHKQSNTETTADNVAAELQPKRKQMAKKLTKLTTLRSVSDLATLFNVATKGESGATMQENRLWLGSHFLIPYTSFLSLETLITPTDFMQLYSPSNCIFSQDDHKVKQSARTQQGMPSLAPPSKRGIFTPHEQPMDDGDMRASLASLLSTSSEYKSIALSYPSSTKSRVDDPAVALVQPYDNINPEARKFVRSISCFLIQLLLTKLTMSAPFLDSMRTPTLISEFQHQREQLEFSVLYCNARFLEDSLTSSNERSVRTIEWILSLSKDPDFRRNQTLLSLVDYMADQFEIPMDITPRNPSTSSVYLSIPLVRWLSMHPGPTTHYSLSTLQRHLTSRLKIPNPLPAAHNLDSDIKLLLFSKRIVTQALLNLYYGSSSTTTVFNGLCSHSSKYLLPLGLPLVQLEFVEEPLFGPLVDPYEKYAVIPVLHPELQFLIAPPRYLEQPAFMQLSAFCAPPLGITRLLPQLILQINLHLASTNLIAESTIGNRTCIMDITGCYLPLEEAYRILCHLIHTGINSKHSIDEVRRELLRYCSHCIYLEGLSIVIDMNCCSSLAVYIQYTDQDDLANCDIGFTYSLDQVVCRVYSTREVSAKEPLLLPQKYRWLRNPELVPVFDVNSDDDNIHVMREGLATGCLQGCLRLLSVPLSDVLAVPPYNPFCGGYSLLTYPGPYLSIIKEMISVLMSISYKEVSQIESDDYLLPPDLQQLGLWRPDPDQGDVLQKSTQARLTLQKNIESAQKLITSIVGASEGLNLFCALDYDSMTNKQLEDMSTLKTTIRQTLNGCFMYSNRCYRVVIDQKPVTGNTSAVLLKQAMDNRMNAVKRIGTEYNHFLLQYRLAFAVQALEDLLACSLIQEDPFIHTSEQVPILGFIEIGGRNKPSSDQDLRKESLSAPPSVKPKDPLTIQQELEPAFDATGQPIEKYEDLVTNFSQESSPRTIPPSDRDSTDYFIFSVHEPSAPLSAPVLDLNRVKLVSTLDYLLGERFPETGLDSMLSTDTSSWNLLDIIGFA